jgi:glutamate racemase
MLDAGVDALVLGCSHYPFLRPAIERVVGSRAAVIDPAPAVARQAARLAMQFGSLRREGIGQVTYFASGDPALFEAKVRCLVEIPGPVLGACWTVGAAGDLRVLLPLTSSQGSHKD